MLITTTNDIPGKELRALGLVAGNVVRAKHIGRDIMASFKTIAGGEIKGYTELLHEARAIATSRMVDNARRMEADAIIAVRYGSAAVMDGASEVMAYGTAVKFV